MALLSVRNLSVAYKDRTAWRRVTHNISFDLRPREALVLLGESGSGKTTTAQAIIGLLPRNARIESGEVRLNGAAISEWSPARRRALYGRVVSLIPQDPTSSLDPVMTIGQQIAEIFKIHKAYPRYLVKDQVLALLERVGLSDPKRRYNQYPHELSGGMRQRVLIAIAIALKPQLIIADEPTSALDVTVQKHILDLIDELRHEHGSALLMVTHDLGVASDRADRIIVMKNGRIEEDGESDVILSAPKSFYTKTLLENDPALTVAPIKKENHSEKDIAVTVANLTITYRDKQDFIAVDDLSFTVQRGTTHAIVGESGSGKTSTIRAICGFLKPQAGKILIGTKNMTELKGEERRRFRQHIQLVYQNPFSSLDPNYSVGKIIAEPLLNFEKLSKADRQDRVLQALHQVELSPDLIDRQPYALSGGQRQRIAIARALILEPEILVLDEAVSALDVTVQGQILSLLQELQQARGLTYIFVSHDLSVVRRISDTISVLHNGKEVESGGVYNIFTRPKEAYTRELIAAIPGKSNALRQSLLSAQL